jgi:hypothetical protein
MSDSNTKFFNHKGSFAAGFLASLLLFAILIGTQARERARRRSSERASGLSAVAGDDAVGWDPVSLWSSRRLVDYVLPLPGRPYPMLQHSMGPDAEAEAKVIRTGTLWLVVTDIPRATEQVATIAHRFGGFTAQSQAQLREGEEQGAVTIRVPSGAFDAARIQLHTLATTLEGETVETRDVSKEFVDFNATLKNARAEEEQYVALLHRAGSIKDVMEVTEKVSGVRERIDRAEGEFRDLSGKVEMCSIQVNLRREPTKAAIAWRPLVRIKDSLRDGAEALADYAVAVFAIVVRLPVVLLWIVTLAYAGSWSWRGAQWLWRHTFAARVAG